MIETETSWKDSGYDCDHCGGQILERTDRETGQPARVCYQCQVCGCQWRLSGDVLRIGNMDTCRRVQRVRRETQVRETIDVRRVWLGIGIGILLLLLLFYSGALIAVRFLIPVAIALLVFWAVYRLGRERMWW